MFSNGDKQLADRIMRYGENLCSSVQFWMARCHKLIDIIKQISH
jgi:hypothetical protein